MTNLREAAQMALDALEEFCEHGAMLRPLERRDALRAALAQPEQEPVAWLHTTATGDVYFRKKPHDKVFNPQPVYTAPPQRETILHTVHCECGAVYKVYEQPYWQIKPPKKKEWQGLTDDDISNTYEVQEKTEGSSPMTFARAIEAKLKGKNA